MTFESRSAFATRIGRNKSTVSRLEAAGRIVLSDDGKLVNVEASLELINQSKGNRDDVAARHEAARTQPAGAGEQEQLQLDATPAATGATPPATDATPGRLEVNEAARQKALAESRRSVAAADREEMERDQQAGKLILREDSDRAMQFIGAKIRSLMDVFPGQVAPLVAPILDINEVEQLLADACRNVLMDLGGAIDQQVRALDEASEQ